MYSDTPPSGKVTKPQRITRCRDLPAKRKAKTATAKNKKTNAEHQKEQKD
jgi:hypothetical protein